MEFVFVVPREKLFPEAYPHGFVPFRNDETQAGAEGAAAGSAPERVGGNSLKAELERKIEEFGFFVERATAEQTPAWKQIIPYTLVVRDGQVLCLKRTSKGGEVRLHDKLSIGVGGHINPEDLADESAGTAAGSASPQERPRNPIAMASQREVVEEELHIQGSYEWRALGLLNDDTNPVGAVHLGWVQSLIVHGEVSVREVDQLQGQFQSVSELNDLLASGANFETWSSLLLPWLDRLIPSLNGGASTASEAPTVHPSALPSANSPA